VPSAEAFAAPDISTEDWVKVTLPPSSKTAELPPAGALWVRRTIDIDEAEAGKPLPLNLGVISGYDRVYWNGQLLAETTLESSPGVTSPRRGGKYNVPPKQVKAGPNTLAIRIYAPVEPAGFSLVPRAGDTELADQWQAKAEYEFSNPIPSGSLKAPSPPPDAPRPSHVPSHLFNAMIHPLLPATISGVIWYQGESNAGRAWQYRTAFPLMITDWRTQWKRDDLPFYFCQLANDMAKKPTHDESAWAELRDAQSRALKLPHTGQAILIDIAKGLVAAPVPATQVLQSATGKTAPLVRNSPQSELEGFSICGADQKWVWADAKIDGDSVLVWSDKVPAPGAVRYAWADNPTCNLVNSATLPASPFRSDDFPAATLKNKL